jgi:cytidylate kinase
VVVAARLGTSPEIVEGLGRTPGFGERLLRSFNAAVPEAFHPAAGHDDLDGDARREIERLLREAAAGGDAVIVGRAAGAVLGPGPGVLRAYLHAPLGWRVERIRTALGVDAATARAEIARIDDARRRYAREGYDVAWGDPHHYELSVDVSRFGLEGTIELLAAAVERPLP